MPLSASTADAQINRAMSAVVLLNASCQAVIEAKIVGVGSSWYTKLDSELGAAEDLVLDWRQSGVLYFSSQVLQKIQQAGNAFNAGAPQIQALLAALIKSPSDSVQVQLVSALQALQSPIQSIVSQSGDYLTKLKAFEVSMETTHQNMQATIAAVQAEDQRLQVQIISINAQIASLNTQIQADRDAISKAESKRTSGIIETIFGVLLTPVTGGTSLILAGIGVASIAEAQTLISSMQTQISGYQQTIAGDQTELSTDDQVIVTLNGLTLSTGMILDDIDRIATALDSLRTGWTAFAGELLDTITKLKKSASASEAVLAEAWYKSACDEWIVIVNHVGDLIGAGTNPSSNNVRIP
ncbi:hypothetical protein JJQ97_00585 [Pseudomonas syringae]|uniref:alpha-pore-forming cytotoxin subunit MakE n=1 Tax=Pseudomonas syringae TaxID=317 RepID=UPI001916E229|nr:hypothetical protein [Pseudomonas syringae]QQQ50784.1 hypothetical protein JJQ97_00585 [Pseudomonas syringae]